MSEEFFVVGGSCDGTTFDGPLTRVELEKRLAEDYYGPDPEFATENPGTDGFCIKLKGKLLIIRGSIIQPRPAEVVTSWKL